MATAGIPIEAAACIMSSIRQAPSSRLKCVWL
jgi:hypothetical protein